MQRNGNVPQQPQEVLLAPNWLAKVRITTLLELAEDFRIGWHKADATGLNIFGVLTTTRLARGGGFHNKRLSINNRIGIQSGLNKQPTWIWIYCLYSVFCFFFSSETRSRFLKFRRPSKWKFRIGTSCASDGQRDDDDNDAAAAAAVVVERWTTDGWPDVVQVTVDRHSQKYSSWIPGKLVNHPGSSSQIQDGNPTSFSFCANRKGWFLLRYICTCNIAKESVSFCLSILFYSY